MELTEEELAAKIKKSVEEATSGLVTKNTELIGTQQSLKDKLKVFDGINLADISAMTTELAKLKEANLSDDERRQQSDAASATALADTQKELVDSKTTISTMSKDYAVAIALTEAGSINEGMGEAVNGLLKGKVTMSEEGIPMIGDKKVGDFVNEWKKEEGKMFFVPTNAGGGAKGEGAAGSEHAKYFEKGGKDYNLTKQAV